MSLDALRESLPAYAKDLSLNLSSLANETLLSDQQKWGAFVASAYAVGTIAGSGIYGWAFAGRRWAAWVTANLLYVASGILIATLDGFWLVASGMVVAGVGSGLLQPITTVVMTEQVPDTLRGRVFGTYSALAMVVSPIGLGLMAMVLAGADLTVGAWALAAGWVVVSAYALVAPGLRDYIRPKREDAVC